MVWKHKINQIRQISNDEQRLIGCKHLETQLAVSLKVRTNLFCGGSFC